MTAKFMPVIERAYDAINTALWGGLVAFSLFFAIVGLPQLKAGWTAQETQTAAEIAAENDSFCRRFQFAPATDAFRSCLNGLNRLRASVERRIAEQYDF